MYDYQNFLYPNVFVPELESELGPELVPAVFVHPSTIGYLGIIHAEYARR